MKQWGKPDPGFRHAAVILTLVLTSILLAFWTLRAAFNGQFLEQVYTWLAAVEVALLAVLLLLILILTRMHHRTGDAEGSRAQYGILHDLIAQSERLNRTVSLEEVLPTIGDGALELGMADGVAIFHRVEEQRFAGAWARFADGSTPGETLPAIEQHINDLLGQRNEPVLLPTPEQEKRSPKPDGLGSLRRFGTIAAWPLRYVDKTTAWVCLFYLRRVALSEERRHILEAFLRQAAVALENARLFEAECAQRRLSDALRDISATLNSTLDLDGVLEGILTSLNQVIQHDAAGIMLIEGDMLVPVRWHGIPQASVEDFKNWRYSIHDLHNRQVMLQTIQALVIRDTASDPHWLKTSGLEWVRSYAGAPICQRGRVTGFIDVMSERPEFFRPEIGTVLQWFANQAAIALENARLYQNIQKRMEETSALYRAIQPLFNPAADILALAQQITRSVTEEFASVHCEILLINEARTHLFLVAQSGSMQLDAFELPLDGPGLTVSAALTGQVIYAPDVRKYPHYYAGSARTRSELVIPMQSGGQVIGVMNLENPELDAFGERERRILISFAERAALGLENARLFSTVLQNAQQMENLNRVAQRKAQEAETLREATASLSSTLELQTVLDSILNQLEQVVPHDSACIFLVENERHMHASAVKGIQHPDQVLYQSFPRDDALLCEIERTLQPVILADAALDPRFHGWGSTGGIHGWMGVPLVTGGVLVGVLTLDRKQVGAYEAEEIELAQAFANQAAVAVQNARLYHAAMQRAHELAALHTATTSLVSTLDLQELLERILAAAASAVSASQAAALHLIDSSGGLALRVQQGIDDDQARSPEWNDTRGPWNWAVREHRPVLISNGHTDPPLFKDAEISPCWQGHSLLIAPLMLENQCMGAISLISPTRAAFDQQSLRLLISFASTATVAIHNAQLHSEVQYLAVTDPLTGIFNRRGFFERAEQVIEHARDCGEPVSAVMIDIDFFKHINDQYGHDAGDAVLSEVARRCQNALRKRDLICRYGGEEFAILLPGLEGPQALAAAQRLFHETTGTLMPTSAGPVPVTISVGVATINEGCPSINLLLKCADQALYAAKDAGRNQVAAWNR